VMPAPAPNGINRRGRHSTVTPDSRHSPMKGNSATAPVSRPPSAERSRGPDVARSAATALRRASLGLLIFAAALGAQGVPATSDSVSRRVLQPPLGDAIARMPAGAPSGGEVFGRIAL